MRFLRGDFLANSIYFFLASSTSTPRSLTSPPLLCSLFSFYIKTGNLLKVTSGPDAGKLCLLDFGLVAEVPEPDREAMVSATIHLANRDWASLVDDFVALDFLPEDCDRGVIIPVMDRVLSPYLAGGGAKAFNFQVRCCYKIFAKRGSRFKSVIRPRSDRLPRHEIPRQASVLGV